MDLLQIIFCIINVISLVFIGVGYFKSKFIIVNLETYNSMVEIVEEYAEMKENDNCGGGTGFFYDQLPIDEDDDFEEREQEKGEQ